uniref:C-factor-like n=1 Tax=Taeniopygia guttata TaxID=59729 RepID=A0A674GDY1_TAEGU|nr:C-factor-like [Taeniopygia guttata]
MEECNNPVVKVMGDPGLQQNILLPHPPQKRGCRRCPPLHPSRQHPQRWHLPDYPGRLPNLAGAAQPAWRAAGMEGLRVGSVLLTGCDGGLGLGLLKGLLEQPSPPRHIFAACLDPQGKAVNEVALGFPNVMILLLDVTDPNSIEAAVRKVQAEVGSAGLNLLINNSSTTRRSTLATETAENMSLVYTTNTIGPLQTSQAFLPLLKKAAEAEGQREMSCSRAAIINISSILGSIEVAEAWEERQDICYRCSKAALNMLTKCLALEYGSSGILCVSVDPGHVTPPLEQGMGPVTLEESVRGVLQLLAQLSATNNGTFWDWRGQRLPW